MDCNFEKYVRFGVHEMWLKRVGPNHNWYITVRSPVLGAYHYAGYWRNSQYTTWEQALVEAKRVACINKLDFRNTLTDRVAVVPPRSTR
jgi:hypothetical protein